jgi:hypothetical protein
MNWIMRSVVNLGEAARSASGGGLGRQELALSALASFDILQHEAFGLRFEREAVADFGIEVCV